MSAATATRRERTANYKKKSSYQKKYHALAGYMFMLPWILGFALLTAWPTFYTIYLSLNSVVLNITGWEITWVGLDNYHMAWFRDTTFRFQLQAFAWMEIQYVPSVTVIAFILALMLNRHIKGRAVFRAIFFLPVVLMSGPVVQQLTGTGGFAGFDMNAFRIWVMVYQISSTIGDFIFFLFAHYQLLLWFTGIPVILFLSALQKIDGGILEAATIDSANSWQILWKITIPMIRSVFMVAMIMTIINLANYTLNPVLPRIEDAIFQTATGLGAASAFAWMYGMVVLALIGIVAFILRTPKDVVPDAVKVKSRRWDEDRSRSERADKIRAAGIKEKRLGGIIRHDKGKE